MFTAHPRGKNHSLIGIMSEEGFEGSLLFDKPVSTVSFLLFLKKIVLPLLRPGDKVVLDTLRVHHSQEAKKLLATKKASFLFLPPYSPDFNPIEYCWSKVKTAVRRVFPKSNEELRKALSVALQEVTRSNCKGWCRKAGWSVVNSFE